MGKNKISRKQTHDDSPLTDKQMDLIMNDMEDAELAKHHTNGHRELKIYYIRTLIDKERLNEVVIEPLHQCGEREIDDCLASSKIFEITTLETAKKNLMNGTIILIDPSQNKAWGVPLENPLGRQIQSSTTETIIYGAKDSFTENLENNITQIRRRLPTTNLKTQKFFIGTVSHTKVVMLYMDGLTNPDFVSLVRQKIKSIDYDQFLDSSQVAEFMEDHPNTIFPQFLETDRPDACAYSLNMGKVVFLVDNTPFAMFAPITFFHLFQSPEDYFMRWVIASFLRCIRFLSFFLSVTLIPLYVALASHHYQMIPIQILYILLESRSKLPFTPFWEAFLMIVVLEIIKEASLRMPTKTGQTLGVIGGIVIGEASVQAGFVSQILIVLIGISAIASFLMPNYLMTKASTLIQVTLLIFSNFFGLIGIFIGIIVILIHLTGLTSLKQPYFAPVAPFDFKDWNDLLIRAPLPKMKTRPLYLKPLRKWRYSTRR